MLRRFPIMTKARVVQCDQEIEGVTLKAGDMVVLPPLHGLDEREFDDPMTVDFERVQSQHCAFGNGVHRCPGTHLAHTELEIALQEWLARIPEFEIDPLRPPRMRGGILGAVLQVGLRWDASATRAGNRSHTSG
jgi:cytochrome P450